MPRMININNEFRNSHERTYDLLLFSVMLVVVACLIFECVYVVFGLRSLDILCDASRLRSNRRSQSHTFVNLSLSSDAADYSVFLRERVCSTCMFPMYLRSATER